MPKGIAIHVGVNHVNAQHYGGTFPLDACEFDAQSMKVIAESQGFETHILLTKDATVNNVLNKLYDAIRRLEANDLLLFTYAGHGTSVPDFNGDEIDGKDEAFVLYDRMLKDDELYKVWTNLKPRVRVVMITDCCHSGTISRDVGSLAPPPILDAKERFLQEEVATRIVSNNVELYQTAGQERSFGNNKIIKACVLLISACQDHETALDGSTNGLFTQNLLSVWEDGTNEEVRTHTNFYQALRRKVVAAAGQYGHPQTPNLSSFGAVHFVLRNQAPFQIVPGQLPKRIKKAKPLTASVPNNTATIVAQLPIATKDALQFGVALDYDTVKKVAYGDVQVFLKKTVLKAWGRAYKAMKEQNENKVSINAAVDENTGIRYVVGLGDATEAIATTTSHCCLTINVSKADLTDKSYGDIRKVLYIDGIEAAMNAYKATHKAFKASQKTSNTSTGSQEDFTGRFHFSVEVNIEGAGTIS